MEEVGEYFIGRPANWRDYYEIAEQQCAEIIGDPENPHRLDPDYGDIWKSVCGLKANTYNENLFEVANGVGYSGDIGTLMGRAMDGNLGYGQRGLAVLTLVLMLIISIRSIRMMRAVTMPVTGQL